jgi:hypothetical protein
MACHAQYDAFDSEQEIRNAKYKYLYRHFEGVERLRNLNLMSYIYLRFLATHEMTESLLFRNLK